MSLFPPICLQAFFTPGASSGNDYTTTMSITPQFYMENGTTNSQYNGTNVAVGMYATSNFNGQIFRIKSISSQSSSSVTAVLEDVNGINKVIDTSGGINGGGPVSGTGYIFEVNSNGLPILTAVNNAPTITFPDSIMGRFMYDDLETDKTTLQETYCVAVGTSTTNYFATSTDGITWTGRGKGPFSTAGYNVAYNGSIWVAVGEGTNTIATSTNGITWTGRGSPITTRAYGITWNGNLWVAVGESPVNTSGRIATSADGINWTDRTPSGIPNVSCVAWNGSLFVAGTIGSGNLTRIYTSPDGVTWTGRSTPSGISNNIRTVAWGNNLWIAGGDIGTATGDKFTLISSSDGITWTGIASTGTTPNLVPVLPRSAQDIAWNGSLWVAVGGNRTTSVITSTNPTVSWVNRGGVFGATGSTSTRGESITWNGSLWVGVGFGLNTIVTSPDGSTWTTQQTDTGLFSGGRGNGVASRFGYPYALSEKRLVLTERGNALAPSIYENDTPATGIFFPATHNLAVSTAGIERMRINNSGNIGIGLSNPDCRLQVINTPTSFAPAIPNASTVLAILSNVDNYSTQQVLAEIGSHGRGSGDFGNIYRYQLGFQNNTNGAGGNFVINAVPTAPTNYGSDGAIANRFTIRYDGNVGIGTTNPSNLLHIQKATSYSVPGNNADGATFGINFGSSTNYTDQAKILCVESTTSNGVWQGDLALYTSFNAGASTEKVRINGAGNVGIGTNRPTQKLDVNGVIRGSGNIVYTQSTTYNMTSSFNSIGSTVDADLMSLTYAPKQTGDVTLLIDLRYEVKMISAGGDDGGIFRLLVGSTELAFNELFTPGGFNLLSTASIISPLRHIGTFSGTQTFKLQYRCYSGGQFQIRRGILTVYELSQVT